MKKKCLKFEVPKVPKIEERFALAKPHNLSRT